MMPYVAFFYGLLAASWASLTVLYGVGFLLNRVMPKTVDSGPATDPVWASVVDIGLLAFFGLQHSIMARSWFRRWWLWMVPEAIERSTYVLFAGVALALVFWQWRPLPGIMWYAFRPELYWFLLALSLAGWLLAFYSTLLIDPFGFVGLRQVWCFLRGREYRPPAFQVRSVYRWIRHPQMAGLLIAFWATPVMTAGHLLFAAGMTVYVAIGITLEERDLLRQFSEPYARYRDRTPALLPRARKRV